MTRWFQWRRGKTPARAHDYANPETNAELLAYDKAQIRELLERYQPDILCFDGYRDATRSLVEYAWSLKREVMITRGGIITPEQERRDEVRGPFEAHYTIGTQWQYKAGNDELKSGRELIELLVDIRSRGGTLLLAVGGPDADGRLPRNMDDRVREIGLWNFVNREATRGVRPWHVTREDATYFTCDADAQTVYAFDTQPPLEMGELAHDRVEEPARDGCDRNRSAGPSRRSAGVSAGGQSQNALAARRGRTAHHLLPDAAPLQQPEVAQSAGAENHERGGSLTFRFVM